RLFGRGLGLRGAFGLRSLGFHLRLRSFLRSGLGRFLDLLLVVCHALVLSRRTVRMRAISRLAIRRRAVFSSAPIAAWKRRLKSSCRVSASRCSSSSSVRSRMSLARKEITALLTPYEPRLHRQLLRRKAQRLLRERLRHTGELEHHAARLHDR